MNNSIANLINEKSGIPKGFQKYEIPLLLVVAAADLYVLLRLFFH